jgi:hypothetical protein
MRIWLTFLLVPNVLVGNVTERSSTSREVLNRVSLHAFPNGILERGKNKKRFPKDFMFQLTKEEYNALRSQFATLKTGRGQQGKYLRQVFTEQCGIRKFEVPILNIK